MLFDFPLQDYAARNPWSTRFASLLLGAATTLSFAPAGWFLLAPALVLLLLFAFFRCPPRQAAQLGFAFGAGLFLAGTSWLYVSIRVFGQAPAVLAICLMLGLVVIMALYYAGTGWLAAYLSGGVLWRFVIVAPAAWVALEWLRGWFLSGFPWMTLGYSQIDSALAGYAPLIGVFGVSLMLMISVSALLAALLSPPRPRLLYLLIAALPWLGGGALGSVGWTVASGPVVRATIVQGGVSQDRKWLREEFRPTLELYRSSLEEHADSDLVLWPEVAIPSVLDLVESYVAELQHDVAASDTMLLFGILERDDSGDQVYNSVVAIDGSSRQVYRKRHLVPFGEFFPVPDFIREWMRMMNLPYSDISAGEQRQALLRMPDGNKLAVAICYEDAYGAEQRYAFPDAGIIINVSNDAWFGDSIAPHQHLQIARMRALEAGRDVVRATNNGVSAFIGADGGLIESGPQFEFLQMTHDVVPRSGSTPYQVHGNWPVIGLALAVLSWFGWRSRSRK